MTIKDIARESGYAVGTVSRALNNAPGVSAETLPRLFEIFYRTDKAGATPQMEAAWACLSCRRRCNLCMAPYGPKTAAPMACPSL